MAAIAEPSLAALTPEPYRVVRRRRETGDTWQLRLVPTRGAAPKVAPGQFMMVYAFGIGEVPVSVSGGAGDPAGVGLTIRAVGAVTRALCSSTRGSVLGLRGPFGAPWPVDAAEDRDVVVVAGGIGLAPLRPVVLKLIEERERYGAVTLLYGARTPRDLLYKRELGVWCRTIAIDVTVDAPTARWHGKVGVVPKLVEHARFDPERTVAYVCGPEIMMRFALGALAARGVPQERLFVSLERHMECGVGLCGHCQLGPTLICRDGPVYSASQAAPWLEAREL